MFFRLETFDNGGKILDKRHVEISCGDVDAAQKSEVVLKAKAEAKKRGLGFRIKREDD